MPLGPYADFGECVGAQKRKGHSDESARKICGSLEQGSSINEKYASDTHMSFGQQQEEKPQETAEITLSQQQAEALAQAAFNDDIEAVKRILTEVMNIEQEPAA